MADRDDPITPDPSEPPSAAESISYSPDQPAYPRRRRDRVHAAFSKRPSRSFRPGRKVAVIGAGVAGALLIGGSGFALGAALQDHDDRGGHHSRGERGHDDGRH